MTKPKLLDRVREQIRLRHYSIRAVQELLGHNDIRTTMIYTHVLNENKLGIKSPFDDLDT